MKAIRWPFLTIMLILIISPLVCASGEETDNEILPLQINGYLKLDTHYRLFEPDSKGNDLATLSTMQLQLSGQANQNNRFFASFKITGNDSFEDGINTALQEGYIIMHNQNSDYRIGKQIIAWGTCDSINPTDNLTPKDYTTGSIEVEDQYIPIPALRADYYLGKITLEGVWIPYFTPAKLPNTLPSGLVVTEPAHKFNNSEFALKLKSSSNGFDYSASYFYGWDSMPTVHQNTGTVDYHQIRVWGADFSKAVGQGTVRGEVAYVQTDDPDGTDSAIANPYLYGVLGADYSLLNDNLTIMGQFSQNTKTKYNEAIDIERKTTSQFMTRITYKFTQFITGGLVDFYTIDDKSQLINPEISFDLADGINLKIGAMRFIGDPDPAGGPVYITNYGNQKDQDWFYLQLKYNF